jgi:membrane dipeptidase
MLNAGLTAANISLIVDENFTQTLKYISQWHNAIRSNSDKAILVKNGGDIYKAKAQNKIGIILGVQNPAPIGNDLELLRILFEMGLRILQITFNHRCLVGDGCAERTNSGLSKFGQELIQEMNRLGVLVDLSHTGQATTLEAIEHSRDPVVFTHANPRAMCDHFRNKSDDEIRALAEHGGVMGITAWSHFCETRRFHNSGEKRPTLEDYLLMLDYVVDLVGVDHVGLGLDLGPTWTPETFNSFKRSYPELCGNYDIDTYAVAGLDKISKLPALTSMLLERGYSNADVKKILGLNFTSVFEKVFGHFRNT